MHKELLELLQQIRKIRGFDPEKWVEEKVKMVNDYFKKCGMKSAVINMSGGVDSSVTFALISRAMKQPDSPIKKLLGITQPIHSTAKIQNRAYLLKDMGEIVEVDQTAVFDMLRPMVEKVVGIGENEDRVGFARSQMKSYMRTPVAYFAAQLLNSQGLGSLVVGTGNFDEDGYLFYFCKAGDGIADIQLIADLHKSEVFKVGKVLEVPDEILEAPPSADLYDGQTDEGELGFSYDFVELYTELIMHPDIAEKGIKNLSEEAYKEFIETEKLVRRVHNANKHKDVYPINLNCIKMENLTGRFVDGEKLRK